MEYQAYELFQDGVIALSDGRSGAAISALERARELEPEKGSIREALGRAYFTSRKYNEAKLEFETAIAIDPVNHYAYFGLGKSLQKLGDTDWARGQFRLALAMEPTNEDYRSGLMQTASA